MLKRWALAVARFEIGWKASPASLTIALGHLRALGDDAVERGAGEFALKLHIFGRRLGFGERTDRVRGLLDAVTAGADGVLAQGAGAFDGNLAGFDDRFDIGAGQIGELFGDLLATLGVLLSYSLAPAKTFWNGAKAGMVSKRRRNLVWSWFRSFLRPWRQLLRAALMLSLRVALGARGGGLGRGLGTAGGLGRAAVLARRSWGRAASRRRPSGGLGDRALGDLSRGVGPAAFA